MCRCLVVLLLLLPSAAGGVRLKDIARLRGVKDNHLQGYGIVIGLSGTGDRAKFTEDTLNLALKTLGVDLKSQELSTKNTAAVVVSALLHPFARVGAKLDVMIGAIGNSPSLEGGTLMLTPLKGADGKVYAMAQGTVMVTKPTEKATQSKQGASAHIPQGAILEREVPFDFASLRELRFQLHHPDFTTSARVAYRLNEELSGKYATAVDAGAVQLLLPYQLGESATEFVAKIESLDVEPDHVARVIVNRKTGTIVLGEQVRLFPASIAHQNLTIRIRDNSREPAAAPLATPAVASGDGEDVAEAMNATNRAPKTVTLSNQGGSVAELATGMNEVGATPDDLLFVLNALKEAGALVAEVELRN